MPVETKPWYIIDDVNDIDSPALVIYLERVKHNIALAINMVGDVSRLRPHVKTHKSAQATMLMLDAGITKFKCATVAEGEILALCEAPDVLLAYPPTGPKSRRLLALIEKFPDTRFSCLIDSVVNASQLAKESTSRGITLDVFIDINIGMNRTGVKPDEAAKLFLACSELVGLNIVGLHGYDGHINDTDITIRRQKGDEAFGKLEKVQEQLESLGLLQPVVVLGGSPTFPMHAARSGVECSPGTFVYWDKSYSDSFPDMDFLPAALVISRVISNVNEKTTCVDLGHKSVAAENPLNRRVHFLNAVGLVPIGQSEEHLVLETPGLDEYRVGDVLYGMPFHVCPTCALYNIAYVIENGRMKEQWQMTARDRKLSV